jgi:hypothetical protein
VRYQFLVDTYETERLKVLSVWGMFHDEDLPVRPHAADPHGCSVLEQMQHQSHSENARFCNMLGIDVAPPLPAEETRLGSFRGTERIRRSVDVLMSKDHDSWWRKKSRSSMYPAAGRGL